MPEEQADEIDEIMAEYISVVISIYQDSKKEQNDKREA